MNAAKPSPGFRFGSPVASFVAVTRGVLLAPAGFFRGLREEGSYAGPVMYAVVCQLVAVVVAAAYDFARAAAGGDVGGISVIGTEGTAGALLWVLWLLGLAPVYALLTLVVGAAVYQMLLVLLAGRRNAGYGATLRVTAYLSAVSLVVWVPIAGLIVGPWGVWINAVGLKELHSTTTARALFVAAVPYALALAWSAFTISSGQTTPWEFLIGGGTGFPTEDAPLVPET